MIHTDDIYFDKHKRRSKEEAAHYDMPPVNEIPFDEADGSSGCEIPGLQNEPFHYDAPYQVPAPEDAYAPYTGKNKKSKNDMQGESYAPYRQKQTQAGKADREEYQEPFRPVSLPTASPPKKKKKKGKIRLIAAVLAGVFVFSFIGIFTLIAASGYTKTKLERNQYIPQAALKSNPLVRNILLIGVDGTAGSTSLRSDSMMLVSIDSLHAKIKISSFMRDSWVEIPDYKYAKLNAACSHGGPQLVVDTIEYNFGVDIEDYVLVNFTMFTDIIDAIGGVDVDITEKEADFINRTTRHTVENGSNVHLDGAEALVYCRIRKLDSDHMRTFRQRKVIKALIKQAKSAGLPALIDAMRDVLPMIETDMGPLKLTCLFFRGGFSALLFKVQSTRIPTDDLSWYGTKGNQSVVELDVEQNAEHLQQFIYTNQVPSEEEAQ